MKIRVTKYILSWVLLLGILLGAVGVPVFAHTCLISGKAIVSVLPMDECGPDEAMHVEETCCDDSGQKEASFGKDDCCMNSAQYFRNHIPVSQYSIKQAELPMPVMIFVLSAFLGFLLTPLTVITPLGGESPPLLSGRERLTAIRVFRI